MNRELLEAYNYQLARINQDEQAGLISDQQAAEYRSQLADELEEAQFSEYEQETEVAEFSAGNSLGATLLEVGEQLGYEDPEEYIVDLADELGLTPEEAYGMIVTDEEPDEELAYDVLDVLGLIEDEDEYEVDGEYDGEYEEDDDEIPGDASYSAYDPRVDELEAQVAEFQAANALKDVLHKLDLRAQQLIENGDMPPVAYEVMFSSFDSEDDRVAMFSQLAEANENSINEELVKMQGIIELFERMGLGEMGMFNELIQEEALSNFNSEEQLSPEEEALIVGTSAAIRASRG